MLKELNAVFESVLQFAEQNQKCLRKSVGCSAVIFNGTDMIPCEISVQRNGPSRDDHECTNVVGNCGCSHSEPRLVQAVIRKRYQLPPSAGKVLVITYSPCTNCANILIDSGLFCGVIYDILTEHDKRGAEFLSQAMPIISRKKLNELTEGEAIDKLKKWISN